MLKNWMVSFSHDPTQNVFHGYVLDNSSNGKCHMGGFFFHELIQDVSSSHPFERHSYIWKVSFSHSMIQRVFFILLFEKKL